MSNLYRIILFTTCLLLTGTLFLNAEDKAEPKKDIPIDKLGSREARETAEKMTPRGDIADPNIKPRTPQQTVDSFKLMDHLAADVVLNEPIVKQPLFMNFDERGRLWVMQYLQYPMPAGLKVVKYDQYLRAVFDKVPPPPPNHFVGKDKITIHEDTDGDGKFDKHKTFVDGLNIATSFAKGRGGVWVLNPPYLLFYPDKNNDDVPDGDPVVHLEGFGLEDTHSVTNSLRWGPDGWLYAGHGSTVTATVKRPGIDQTGLHFKGQAIWRYHPETKRFELFAEGGGNTFGVEFDSKGRVYSGHNGGNTRGFHFVQGGYYQKNWGKHGQLTNPYAYGYFNWMKHHSAKRFSHTFVIYEAPALHQSYHGKLLGPVPLHQYVVVSELSPDTSSFKTKDIGQLVHTEDNWFRPVDIKVGPDGYIYLADWYDTRLTHLDPRDNWDKERGRIYRIKPAQPNTDTNPHKPFNLNKKTSLELVELLKHENKWFRQTANRVLADRKDKSILPALKELLKSKHPIHSLEALWAIHVTAGLDESTALTALQHANPHVRRWAVRFLGDNPHVSHSIAQQLINLAKTESDIEVRSQLASSAKRFAGAIGLNDYISPNTNKNSKPPSFDTALQITQNLLTHHNDINDIHLPLLNWWTTEQAARIDPAATSNLLSQTLEKSQITRDIIAQRLVRMLLNRGTDHEMNIVADMLNQAEKNNHTPLLMRGVTQAFNDKATLAANLTPKLAQIIARNANELDAHTKLLLQVQMKNANAINNAINIIKDEKADKPLRLKLIPVLARNKIKQSIAPMLTILAQSRFHSVRRSTLKALMQFDEPQIAKTVIDLYYKNLPAEDGVRDAANQLLASRQTYATQLIHAIAKGTIKKQDISPDVIALIRLRADKQLTTLLNKHYPEVKLSSDFQTQVDKTIAILKKAKGNPARGKELFARCAACHKLHGEGSTIGPDLTGYERTNIDLMVLSIVAPSAAIREEYTNYLVTTKDGRTLLGLIADKSNAKTTLKTLNGSEIIINNDNIASINAMTTSLMPPALLSDLNEQQIQDLFAYLMSEK